LRSETGIALCPLTKSGGSSRNCELSNPLSQVAQSIAERIEQGRNEAAAVETTLEEKRALIDALDHSPRARSLRLRQLEIELHAAIFSEQPPWA
jgi:hypothetical protein